MSKPVLTDPTALYDIRNLASYYTEDVRKPLIGIFLEEARDVAKSQGDLEFAAVCDAVAHMLLANGSNYVTELNNLYAKIPSRQRLRLTDLMAKLDVMVHELSSDIAVKNIRALVTQPAIDKALEEARRTGKRPVYSDDMLDAGREAFWGPPPQRNETFGSGDNKPWRLGQWKSTREIFSEIDSVISVTPHPTEFFAKKSRNIINLMRRSAFAVTAPLIERMNNYVENMPAVLDTAILRQYMREYIRAELTPTDENGDITRVTALDEINDIVDAVNAARRPINSARRSILDRAEEAGEFFKGLSGITPEERLKFHLRQTFASWGPDIDGHPDKKVELMPYEKALQRLNGVLFVKRILPLLGEAAEEKYTADMARAKEELKSIITTMLAAQRGNEIPLKLSELNALSERIEQAIPAYRETYYDVAMNVYEESLNLAASLETQLAALKKKKPKSWQDFHWEREKERIAQHIGRLGKNAELLEDSGLLTAKDRAQGSHPSSVWTTNWRALNECISPLRVGYFEEDTGPSASLFRRLRYAVPTIKETQRRAYADLCKILLKNLEPAFLSEKDPARRDQIEDAINELRNFGLHGAALELRQDSLAVRTAAGALIPAYGQFKAANGEDPSGQDRAKKIDELLLQQSHPAVLSEAELYKKTVEWTDANPGYEEADKQAYIAQLLLPPPDHITGSAARLYEKAAEWAHTNRDYKDPDVRAYHETKRVEELLNTEDMRGGYIIANNIDESSMMEALLLQRAVAPYTGNRLAKIMPLSESFQTLPQTAEMLLRLVKNHKSYRAYLIELTKQLGRYDEATNTYTIPMEVMIPHSDITKVAGNWAAHAAKLKVHQQCQALFDAQQKDIQDLFRSILPAHPTIRFEFQFFEGWSKAQFNRGGLRPSHATTNRDNSHMHTHHTIQGHDAEMAHEEERFAGMVASDQIRRVKTINRMRVLKEEPEYWFAHNSMTSTLTRIFLDAEPDYREKHYSEGVGRGIHYAHPGVNYPAFAAIVAGSRPSKRNGSGKPDCTYTALEVDPVNVDSMRAIPDVYMQFMGYIQGTFLGSLDIERRIYEGFQPTGGGDDTRFQALKTALSGVFREEIDEIFDDNSRTLTKEGAYYLYKASTLYRSAIDTVAYGIAQTRFDLMEDMLKRGEDQFGIKVAPAHRKYLDLAYAEYEAASKLVLKSFKCELPVFAKNTTALEKANVYRAAVLKGALPHLAEEIESSWLRAEPFIRRWQDILMEAHQKGTAIKDLSQEQLKELRLCIAGTQPLSHPNRSLARSPAYAYQLRAMNDNRKRPEHMNKLRSIPVELKAA